MFGTRARRRDPSANVVRTRRAWVWIRPALYVTIGLLVGFALGRFGRSALPDVRPTTTWDIVDILNVLVTLTVALYLQSWVAERSEGDRAKRTYLVQLTERIDAAIRELHRVVRSGKSVEGEVITSTLRNVNGAIVQLRSVVAMTRANCSLADLELEWRRYREKLQDFPWQPLTERERMEVDASFGRVVALASRIVLELYSA